MKTETHQRRKILPGTGEIADLVCSDGRQVKEQPKEKPVRQEAFALLRTTLCIGAASAVAMCIWASLSSPGQAVGMVIAQNEGLGSAASTAQPKTLNITPVAPHSVLPTFTHGKSHQDTFVPTGFWDALYSKKLSFDARISYIDSLERNLSSEDIKFLLNYLQQQKPDDGLQTEQRRALVNDVIFALRSQKTAPAELTRVLIGIYSDKQRDTGLRDYAIQHLSEWRWNATRLDPASANQIDETLWSAAQETDQTFGGTALLALQRLVEDTKMPDYDAYAAAYKQRLAATAVTMAANEQAPLAARITALGICAQNTPPQAAALAVGFLDQANTPNTLQLAALGVLIRSIPPGAALQPDTRIIIERAAQSLYPPVQKLAATTLHNHTF